MKFPFSVQFLHELHLFCVAAAKRKAEQEAKAKAAAEAAEAKKAAAEAKAAKAKSDDKAAAKVCTLISFIYFRWAYYLSLIHFCFIL